MDLAKFIWTLENQKLYMSRLDMLSDPHEGSTPKLMAKLRDHQFHALGADQLVVDMPRINQRVARSTYVNCWHMGNAESEAMWRLYCPGENGVAIQTTYSSLVNSISADKYCYIGAVTYIDYESQAFPHGNLYYASMHKRLSFEHEREIRLVKIMSEYCGLQSGDGPGGITIDWPLETAAHAIFVNPYAPAYYYEVVQSVVKRIATNLENRVFWSQMKASPVY